MQFNIEETWCFTGHRPGKLYGYDKNAPGNVKLRQAIKDAVILLHLKHGINNFITGMAMGWDMWAAEVVFYLKRIYPNIKLICAIPCKGHLESMPLFEQEEYEHILDEADYIHYVTNMQYTPQCLQKRNEWMVDNSVGQIAGWDGTKGGTYNCIKYANKKYKTKRIRIHPVTLNVTFLGV